jgi:glycosyltransferase involved in cell wall biosynthesis
MNVLFFSTFEKYGGAAMASYRLFDALQKNTDADYHLLVTDLKKSKNNVITLHQNFLQQKIHYTKFVLERLHFWSYMKDKSHKYAFSPANYGVNQIEKHFLVKEADILHLNWINFGFLSLKNLEKLCKTHKKIVWTMHDMWAFTGGCHYAGNCKNFENQCGNCQFLKNAHEKDWSFQIFQKKKEIFKNTKIHFVGSSQWITKEAQKSGLWNENHTFQNIPTPIDTQIFKPLDKMALRKKYNLPENKFFLLFGAMNIADKRKGFNLLLQSLFLYKQKNINNSIHLLIFGKSTPELLEKLPFSYTNLGILKDENSIKEAYNLAHAFVLPSLEDNLPNTILESLACGTPAVAYQLGGMTDMIDPEKNGFLAQTLTPESLYLQIEKIINIWENNVEMWNNFEKEARQKALKDYSESVVAKKYFEMYQSL